MITVFLLVLSYYCCQNNNEKMKNTNYKTKWGLSGTDNGEKYLENSA